MASQDRLAGVLLGTAIGDALGLPVENLPAKRIARLFGRVTRYRFLGKTGYVSDDTEQSAFVAQALVVSQGDAMRCARSFARRLRAWILRLPFGVGLATLRACFKLLFFLPVTLSGVRSAGNGAAMRAAIVGAYFADDPQKRVAFSEAIARVTHTDPRAVEGAGYVAALAALAVKSATDHPPELMGSALEVVHDPSLRAALEKADRLAQAGATTEEAAQELGVTGFVLHTVPFAAFCARRFGDDPRVAIEEAANAGGDTDTIAAIVGALVGARHGESGLPQDLVEALEDGPLGKRHLRALARALAEGSAKAPRSSGLILLVRNALLVPVILGHVAYRIFGAIFLR